MHTYLQTAMVVANAAYLLADCNDGYERILGIYLLADCNDGCERILGKCLTLVVAYRTSRLNE